MGETGVEYEDTDLLIPADEKEFSGQQKDLLEKVRSMKREEMEKVGEGPTRLQVILGFFLAIAVPFYLKDVIPDLLGVTTQQVEVFLGSFVTLALSLWWTYTYVNRVVSKDTTFDKQMKMYELDSMEARLSEMSQEDFEIIEQYAKGRK